MDELAGLIWASLRRDADAHDAREHLWMEREDLRATLQRIAVTLESKAVGAAAVLLYITPS